ncbi:hypothetical protein LTV02_33550 [Nocardia yamanashiensis]|uniref:hypothetical protein n=1 Tax=Nocardia yamanashiensis TaxID=209247 RepID=UPI001E379C13|nr:hypothetical protein [Nocardia yamanashiensis]UGT40854.1 hypothetical protein LTV02_33550 [Nocardia yamanashiensis]
MTRSTNDSPPTTTTLEEPAMSINLTAQDNSTIRTAAYGAISLLAAASPKPAKAASAGTIALTSATGLVGHVLAAKSKDIKLEGKTTAELADHVLPALTAAVTLLAAQDKTEADNFRATVNTAIEAAHAGQPQSSPTMNEMTRKIVAALDAA